MMRSVVNRQGAAHRRNQALDMTDHDADRREPLLHVPRRNQPDIDMHPFMQAII